MDTVTEKSSKKATAAQFETVKTVSVTDAIYQASQISAGVGGDRVLPRQVASGSYFGQQNLGGDGKVNFDSSAGRIVVEDDNDQRFIAGAKFG